MAKARRELGELMTKVDVVIEVLDARMPLSSRNPLVNELRGERPCIEVLTKSDMADPVVTKAWLRAFEATKTGGRVAAMASSTNQQAEARARIAALADEFGAKRKGRTMRALIAGIPNVGKSTLINTLMSQKVARVSDKPAVTQNQQRVVLPNGMIVTDTPGLMSPNIEDESAALRLAFGGSIPATAVDYEVMAISVGPYLLQHYAQLLDARFKLGEIPENADALLQAIGKKRGFLKAGGGVDTHKAAEVLVNEFRSGKLGRISLERP